MQDLPEQDVLVILDIDGLEDCKRLERHLKREGLKAVGGEEFCYIGKSSTHKINTMLYIFDGVKKALKKGGFDSCSMVVQIGEYGMETFRFDHSNDEFVQI